MRAGLVSVAAVAAAAALIALGGGSSAAAAAELERCPEDVEMKILRCGRLHVPLERADPSLGKIRLTYAVRRPNERERRPLGTIFAVEGGPGYGSIDSAPYYAAMLGRRLLDRYRLITVDMRGTGRSGAIDCPG